MKGQSKPIKGRDESFELAAIKSEAASDVASKQKL